MSNGKCEMKSDTDRTVKAGKFRRGHFDVTVFNPSVFPRYRFTVLKGQKLERLQTEVLSQLDADDPMILYAIEFMCSRDEIKPSRGTDKWRAARDFAKKVRQD